MILDNLEFPKPHFSQDFPSTHSNLLVLNRLKKNELRRCNGVEKIVTNYYRLNMLRGDYSLCGRVLDKLHEIISTYPEVINNIVYDDPAESLSFVKSLSFAVKIEYFSDEDLFSWIRKCANNLDIGIMRITER